MRTASPSALSAATAAAVTRSNKTMLVVKCAASQSSEMTLSPVAGGDEQRADACRFSTCRVESGNFGRLSELHRMHD